MATRKPLVLLNGLAAELPPGDAVAGAAVGSLTAGSGLAGGGDLSTNQRVDVSLAASPSGLIFVGNRLGLDGAAQASGNAALSSAALKLPLSGGVVSGQLAQNIVSLGLYGSGINTGLGNYFTAIVSGATTVVISGSPSNVAYGFAYEVNHQTGTITWPSAVKWPANTAPTLTTGKVHLFMFVTDDSGSTWRASSLVDYAS